MSTRARASVLAQQLQVKHDPGAPSRQLSRHASNVGGLDSSRRSISFRHELLQKPLRAALGSETWLRYPLILPGLIVAVVIALRFRRFTQTIGATRRRLVMRRCDLRAGRAGYRDDRRLDRP